MPSNILTIAPVASHTLCFFLGLVILSPLQKVERSLSLPKKSILIPLTKKNTKNLRKLDKQDVYLKAGSCLAFPFSLKIFNLSTSVFLAVPQDRGQNVAELIVGARKFEIIEASKAEGLELCHTKRSIRYGF